MELSQGFRALTIGYMIPLILLIVTFMILTIAGVGELPSAMFSFLSVALYYLAVWLLRSRIDKKFEFKIKV
jgi:sigma-E factor negative regulatory protein RseC